MPKTKSGKTFSAWRKLTGYNEIYLDPFLEFIGENDNYFVLKSKMGVDDKIVCFKKGISVTIEPIEWDRKSKPILTLGGMDVEILELKTRKGRKTLSYPMEREELSDELKDEILKEKI